MMFSATMPAGVERLSRKYLRRPAYVIIGEAGKAADRIEQRVQFCHNENDKLRQLTTALTEGPRPPIIIFVNRKKTCDYVANQCSKLGLKPTTLHSGRSQHQREASIDSYRQGKYDVLVATDVAGRGIDIKGMWMKKKKGKFVLNWFFFVFVFVLGVTHVINFDMPKSIEDYTHRIGRTGRMGQTGLATSFITNEDS